MSFGAKARSARATEGLGLGEGFRVRGGTGAGRSRVGGGVGGRDRAEMGPRGSEVGSRSGVGSRFGRGPCQVFWCMWNF